MEVGIFFVTSLQKGQQRQDIRQLAGYEGNVLQETIYQFTEDYPEVFFSIAKYSHEDLFRLISNDEIDLVLSYQRRAFSENYENFHLRYIPCLVEVSKRSRLSGEETLCPDHAKQEQQELEKGFYQNVLGIGSS